MRLPKIEIDGFTWVVGLVASSAVLAVPAVLLMTKDSTAFNQNSNNIATTISGIVGPFLTFFTLVFALLNNYSDNRDRRFQQALDLIERLLTLYASKVAEYDEAYRSLIQYNRMEKPIAESYVADTHALFCITLLAVRTNRGTDMQYRGLLGILDSQLKPMVERMKREATNALMGEEEHSIIENQLAQLKSLPRRR